jgi:hypothetical protein
MTRPECAGKDDESDRCDLYDSEGWCHWYGDTWKDDDGVYRGGEEVERITYCTHRTIKGKPINWGTNPLIMDRICHWTEVMFDGEVRSRHHDLYNQNGIIVWGDGTMHDPKTKKTICADGTVIEDDHFGGNLAMRESNEKLLKHLQTFTKKIKDDNSTEPHTRRIMESTKVDKKHRCWGWYARYNNVCHVCRFSEKCCVEWSKREKK